MNGDRKQSTVALCIAFVITLPVLYFLSMANEDAMTEKERTPKAGFFVTIGLGIMLAYAGSIGPLCWGTSRTGWGASAMGTIYRPILSLGQTFPKVEDVVCSFSEFGASVGWHWSPDKNWTQQRVRFSVGALEIAKVRQLRETNRPKVGNVSATVR